MVLRLKRIDKSDVFLFSIITILAAIQNGYFDTIFHVNIFGGMDAVSLLLTIALIGIFAYRIINKKIKITMRMVLAIWYACLLIILGYMKGASSASIFVSFRIYLYLILGYHIALSMHITKRQFISAVSFAGLAGAIIYLGFYFVNVGTSTAGYTFRDVSINLYWAFLSVGFALYEKKEFDNQIIRFACIACCSITIVVSQQRSIIIPLVVLFVWYVITNLNFNAKSVISVILLLGGAYFAYQYMLSLGNFWEVLQRRFSADLFIGQNSTLTYRFLTMKNTFSGMNIVNWIIGTGFGGSKELEMWLPNYVTRMGVVGTIFILSNYYSGFIRLFRNCLRKTRDKKIPFIFLIMTIGGFLTGYSFESGQLLLGLMSGILASSSYASIVSYAEGVREEKITVVHNNPCK